MDKDDVLIIIFIISFIALIYFFVKTIGDSIDLYLKVEQYLRDTGNEIGLKALEVFKDLVLVFGLVELLEWINDILNSHYNSKETGN